LLDSYVSLCETTADRHRWAAAKRRGDRVGRLADGGADAREVLLGELVGGRREAGAADDAVAPDDRRSDAVGAGLGLAAVGRVPALADLLQLGLELGLGGDRLGGQRAQGRRLSSVSCRRHHAGRRRRRADRCEHLVGADALTVNDLEGTDDGGDGDVLIGGAGADTLLGSAGDDVPLGAPAPTSSTAGPETTSSSRTGSRLARGAPQAGYSSFRQARGSAEPSLGVRSSRNM
jgi:hypothetical protein